MESEKYVVFIFSALCNMQICMQKFHVGIVLMLTHVLDVICFQCVHMYLIVKNIYLKPFDNSPGMLMFRIVVIENLFTLYIDSSM